MSDANLRQIRVLHVLSTAAVTRTLESATFLPLLTRIPKDRVKAQAVCLAPGLIQSAVLRQNGVPVHEVALSRQRFSMGAFADLLRITRAFRPDVIQAWGLTAQALSVSLRKRCEWQPKLVWSVAHTAPLPRNAGIIDRQKLKLAAKRSVRADRIVYASEAAAAQHRRIGFAEDAHLVIAPGVDAARFKPDPIARNRIREQLELGPDDVVIGMAAPFQAEYDHATFLKAAGELLKTNPHIAVVLAGHGVQKGNAPLMALIGGGTLGNRARVLGEWSDVASLFNACDIVCSSALTDNARMTLVMAMLCGVPCVATGMGAQGEVIGQHGIGLEPGSVAAFVKGITRVLQMPADRRNALTQGARKHALKNFVSVRSLQQHLQLYYELIGRQALVVEDPAPLEAEEKAAAAMPETPAPKAAHKAAKPAVAVEELADPDSLETKVSEAAEPLPKWRLEQEAARARREQELSRQLAAADIAGDVLQGFDASSAARNSPVAPQGEERARGVAEEIDELLPVAEVLATPVPAKRAPGKPPGSPLQGDRAAVVDDTGVTALPTTAMPSPAAESQPAAELPQASSLPTGTVPAARDATAPDTASSPGFSAAPVPDKDEACDADKPAAAGTMDLPAGQPGARSVDASSAPVMDSMDQSTQEWTVQLELLPDPGAEPAPAVEDKLLAASR